MCTSDTHFEAFEVGLQVGVGVKAPGLEFAQNVEKFTKTEIREANLRKSSKEYKPNLVSSKPLFLTQEFGESFKLARKFFHEAWSQLGLGRIKKGY